VNPLAQTEIIVQIIDYADRLGLVTVLLIIVFGAYRGWWITPREHKEVVERCNRLEEEKNAWMDTALKASNIATDAFNVLRRRG
jgi:hypothetical protein